MNIFFGAVTVFIGYRLIESIQLWFAFDPNIRLVYPVQFYLHMSLLLASIALTFSKKQNG